MTAEIAILNTHGVALAADSAITINVGENEQKIYNSANKIFTLSKYYPVGVMIFNNANFMEIEWEIIIKEYRKSLGNTSFDNLFEYADHFLDYVANYEYISIEQQKRYLFSLCLNVFSRIKNLFIDTLKNDYKEINNISSVQIHKSFNKTIKEFKGSLEEMTNENDFDMDVEFINSSLEEIDQAMKFVFENFTISKKQKNELIDILYNDIQKGQCIRNKYSGYSGIVITGYGNKEIFPSICVYHVFGKAGKSFIRINAHKDTITFEHMASILPFAQTEMVNSFMEGIDPIFENTIIEQLETLVDAMNVLDKTYQEKLNKIKNNFFNYIKEFKRNVYIDPIMDIVKSLQKSDLA